MVFYTDLGLGISAGPSADSTGGTMPGRNRNTKAAESAAGNQPVASNAGAKMDEAETEDGPAALAKAPANERHHEAAGEEAQARKQEAQQRVVGDYHEYDGAADDKADDSRGHRREVDTMTQ